MTNYSDVVIKQLWTLTGNMCAFPNCLLKMVNDDGIIVGESCHIEGEKQGSARYNQNMTDKERSSFDNLVIFCPNHHTEVDKNHSKYNVQLLKEIKRNHEDKYRKNPYNVPDQILKIMRVSVNYDEYSLERIHNLLKIFKKLQQEQTKNYWFEHIKYVLNGLTILPPIPNDKKEALLAVFNEIIDLKTDNPFFPEVIWRFLERIPNEGRSQYIEKIRPYIEYVRDNDPTNPYLAEFYKYLGKSDGESLEFLIGKAGDLNNDQFKRLLSGININFKTLEQDERIFMDFERRLWEMLDNAEKEREKAKEQKGKERYDNVYQNIAILVNKFVGTTS